MTTARDGVVIDFEPEPLVERATEFRDAPGGLKKTMKRLGIREKKGWDQKKAQSMLKAENNLDRFVTPVLYRPFDERFIFYHDSLVWRTARAVMHHMIDGENLGLITTRQTRDDWDALVTEHPIGHKALAAYDINTLFPLWRYPEPEGGLFDAADGERTANLAPGFVAALEDATGLAYAPRRARGRRLRLLPAKARLSPSKGDSFTREGSAATAREAGGPDAFTPEDVFHYLYGVLHAPAYRARYADFLKTDYPRVPLPPSADAFRAFADLGRRLVALHLLCDVPDAEVRYPVKGSNAVEKGYPTYVAPGETGPDGETADTGRVYINDAQYFDGIEPEVWAHEVGGYQVLDKWLKDRRATKRGGPLSYDELKRYPQIVAALRATQRLMAEAEEVAEDAFGW